MNFKIAYSLLFLLISIGSVLAQHATIDITEQTIKLNKKEVKELSYAFAEGDKIIFSIEVLDKKSLSTLEIIEYPENSKFSQHNVSRIQQKVLVANKKGVYTFKLKNAKKKALCKIKIQRIPNSPAKNNFNTTVRWMEKYDTTYTDTMMKVKKNLEVTVKAEGSKFGLMKTEYEEEIIIDRVERIQGYFNMSETNRRYFAVQLPQDEVSKTKSKKMKAWAYWLANSQEADYAWSENVRIISGLTSKVLWVANVTPLAQYALGEISKLAIPRNGDDVEYYFMPNENSASQFYRELNFNAFDKGRGPGAYAKHRPLPNRTFYIGLANDNLVKDIDVKIKIAVVWEIEHYGNIQNTAKEMQTVEQTKMYRKPHIKKIRVPIY